VSQVGTPTVPDTNGVSSLPTDGKNGNMNGDGNVPRTGVCVCVCVVCVCVCVCCCVCVLSVCVVCVCVCVCLCDGDD